MKLGIGGLEVGMKTEDFFYMREALKEAVSARERGEVPIGCVIVNEGKIIARESNRMEELHQANAHAEMLTLQKASEKLGDYRLTDATLYTTLEPCPMCAGAIKLYRIKRVVCALRDYKKGGASSVFNIIPAEFGILEDESERLIKDFFRTLRDKS